MQTNCHFTLTISNSLKKCWQSFRVLSYCVILFKKYITILLRNTYYYSDNTFKVIESKILSRE